MPSLSPGGCRGGRLLDCVRAALIRAGWPDRAGGRPLAAMRVGRVQGPLDAELEQFVVGGRHDAGSRERGEDGLPQRSVVQPFGAAGEVELVVRLFAEEGVERIAAVAQQVAAFG